MKNLMFRLANTLTGMGTSLMAGEGTSNDDPSEVLNTAYSTFKNVVGTILPILIGVVLVIGMFYGISLGIKFAKAEDTDGRDKVKSQLINLCIGVGVAALIMIICLVLVQNNVFQGAFNLTTSGKNN